MIVLVGFMGAGKSSVGAALAERLGLNFTDTDALIEQHSHASIADIFAAAGEPAFRSIESEVVAEVLGGEAAVVALGGGALGDAATCAALESSIVVYLQTSFQTAMDRIGDRTTRPMLSSRDPRALFVEREEMYFRVADISVSTDGRSPEEVAEEVARRVEELRRQRPAPPPEEPRAEEPVESAAEEPTEPGEAPPGEAEAEAEPEPERGPIAAPPVGGFEPDRPAPPVDAEEPAPAAEGEPEPPSERAAPPVDVESVPDETLAEEVPEPPPPPPVDVEPTEAVAREAAEPPAKEAAEPPAKEAPWMPPPPPPPPVEVPVAPEVPATDEMGAEELVPEEAADEPQHPAATAEETAPEEEASARIIEEEWVSDEVSEERAAAVAAVTDSEVEAEERPTLRRVPVEVPGRRYQVVVGRGLAGSLADHIEVPGDAEIAFVITHPVLEDKARLAAASLEESGLRVNGATIQEGETAKSMSVVERLYDQLATAGAHRHDLLVSFGGGVVCDVTGFVASTYHRGLSVAHVPTTLLAQVDAAIGGKTAVNLAKGKNLVGTFHQPSAVVCDVDLLDTLPQEELVSGLGEVVKYGLIADPDLLQLVGARSQDVLARDGDLLVEIVERCAAIKASIVASDEREHGERAALNYGHTFGHAIEQVLGFTGIRHGEAISLGMMAAAYLAKELGRLDDDAVEAHRTVLKAVGLPTERSLDHDLLAEAWRRDKKYRRGVRFVLLRSLGDAEAGIEAPADSIRRAVERLSE